MNCSSGGLHYTINRTQTKPVMEELVNNLIDSIDNFNVEEAIYWAHLIKQKIRSSESFSSCPLSSIFKGFQLGNHELSSILADLIWETLKDEDFPIIIQNYKSEIIEGLSLNDETINKLCIRIIFDLGIGKGHEIVGEMLKDTLKLLNSSKYSVSSYLIDQLIKYNQSSYCEFLLELYSKLPSDDSIMKFRYLELFQKLNMRNAQLYDTFFTEIKSILVKPEDDLLFTANVLQIIQDCIDRREQFEIFNSEGIIDDIIRIITNNSNNDILISKSLDIIANCAINGCFDSEFIYSKGLNRIIYDIEPVNASSVFCSCSIASLCPNDIEMISNLFHNFFINGTSSIQLAALHGLGIYFKSNSTIINHVSLLSNLSSYGWFKSWLPERLNSSFDEQKTASYFALKSIISSSSDSFKFILNNTNLFANLLERSLDSSLLGLKWKYGIIEDIRIDQNLFDCLNVPLKEMVVNYLRNGVTFIPKTSQVAYEGQN